MMTHASTPGARSVPRALALAVLTLAVTLVTGCGYSLVGRGANLPTDVRSVYIKPFANLTNKVQVEQFVAQAVADELVTRQRFSIVASPESANAQISGTVVAAGLTPVTFDQSGRATEFEVSIVAKVEFRRLDSEGTVIWSSDRYTFRESYPADVSSLNFFDLESVALEEAAKSFAETMVSDLLEGF
jgi:outer membrane lipopolysaccharide assembly protein LptE/RlpB